MSLTDSSLAHVWKIFKKENIEVFLKQLHREMNSILNNVHTYISKKYGIPQKKSKWYSKLNIMLGFVMMWQQVNEERPIDGFTLTAEICANRTTPSLLIDLFPELSWICTPLKGHLWWKKCQLQILIQWIYNWAIPLSTVIENFIFFCQKQ